MAFEKDIERMFKTLVGDFSLYMKGDGVYIEGVKKVLSVNDEKITLTLKKGSVTVTGTNLSIEDCGKGYFSLSGNIKSVEKS